MAHTTNMNKRPLTTPRVTTDQRIELSLLAAELRRHKRCGDCRDARTIRAKINAVLDEC